MRPDVVSFLRWRSLTLRLLHAVLIGSLFLGVFTSFNSVEAALQVDPANREEVRAFFNAVYHASDGVPIESSADVGSCDPGTNSAAFNAAVLLRINWFRALAGVPAAVTFNEQFSQDAQRAALMMSVQGATSHIPPSSWVCWAAAGSNAAYHANLVIDVHGPAAITRYMYDYGDSNSEVGHRRMILYPQTRQMGTGDVPSQGGHPPANATWVFDEQYGGPRPPTRQRAVAWPPAGYVPYPVVFRRWSFADPGASFVVANVSMLSNGVPVAVEKEPVKNGVGENTLVWVPAGLDPDPAGHQWPRPATDTIYTVTVSDVFVLGRLSNFTYNVTLFDPEVSSGEETVLSGPTSPLLGIANVYQVQAVPHATAYQWRASQVDPLGFSDGAEQGATHFIVGQTPGYSIVQLGAGVGGSAAFHLAQPHPYEQQTLTFGAWDSGAINLLQIVPGTNAILTFNSRLGYSGDGQYARVQVSTDQGNRWVDVYQQQGSGGAGELVFTPREIDLSSYVGRSIQLRFAYDFDAGGFFALTEPDAGWLIDDVTLSDCEQLGAPVSGEGASLIFTPTLERPYFLEARGLMFGQFALSWGPGLRVVPVQEALRLLLPLRVGNMLQIEFVGEGGAHPQLLVADQPAGGWVVDANAVLDTNQISGNRRFITEFSDGSGFYQLQTE